MTKKINLSQGKFALVDDDIYEYINQWKWCAVKVGNTFYAAHKNKEGKNIKMHRIIMNAPDDLLVDHIDLDGLNNTRKNLRICTKAQNSANRKKQINNKTGYKGVSKERSKYRAYIQVDGKTVHLGSYDSPQTAAKAYDKAAVSYFGEFANTNF